MRKSLNLSILFLFIWILPLKASVEYDSIKILVDNHVITKNEIELRAYELANVQSRGQVTSDLLEQTRKEAIDQLIEETLLDIRADELNIRISEAELEEEIDRFRDRRNITQLEFEELLEKQKLSFNSFRNNFRQQLRRNRVVAREIRSKIDIDEEALKKAYEEDSETEKLVRARHILLRVDKTAADETVAAVKQKALDLRQRIQSGESFKKIADTHSEDPSVKANHGDLGFFKKGDMVKEFAEAAFSLDPGEISAPVRSPFGFHLIEVLDTKTEAKKSFETVKDQLMQQRYQKELQEELARYISDLKEKATITYK